MKKEKKKKIMLAILAVLLGIGLYFLLNYIFIKSLAPQESALAVTALSTEAKANPLKLLATLSNAEVSLPSQDGAAAEIKVRLKDNQAKFFAGNQAGTVVLVKILKTQKTSDGVDIFCDFAVDFNTAASYHFIALFKITDDSLIQTSSFLAGNQAQISAIDPADIASDDYQIKGNYLVLGQEGSISVREFTFSVKNHKIVK